MRRLLFTGLTLACLAGGAAAGDVIWRPAATRPATPGTAPIASTPMPTPRLSAGVSLDKPRPLSPAPAAPQVIVDPGLQRTSFKTTGVELLKPTIRAQNSDALPPKPPAPLAPMDGESITVSSSSSVATWGTPPKPSPLETAPAPAAPPASLVTPPTVVTDSGPDLGPGGLMCTEDGCGPVLDGPVIDGEQVWTVDSVMVDGNQFWLRGEYLLWATKNVNAPILATTGSAADAVPGALGQPNTRVLFGGGNLYDDLRSGARFQMGYWCDPCRTIGFDVGGFFLLPSSTNFVVASNAFPVIARPFQSALTGAQDAEQTAIPRGGQGTLQIDSETRLWGLDANLRKNLYNGCWWRVDVLGGFRYLDLEDDLTITEHVVPTAGDFAGQRFTVTDSFQTRNNFYGGQLGTVVGWRRGRWGVDFSGKVALGWTHQSVDIAGSTVGPNGQVPPGGGLLALRSNIGHYNRNQFAVVPEMGITVGYQVTDNVRVFAGYNFLYWSSVVRAADQIDPRVNQNLVPSARLTGAAVGRGGPQLPMFQFRDTDFWAQGLTAGIEFRY